MLLTLGSGPPAEPVANPTQAPPTDMQGMPSCDTPQLDLTLGQSEGAVGHVRAVFILRNMSDSGCRLYGYPGLLLLDTDGQPLPTDLSWGGPNYLVPDVAPRSVLVEPGDAASFAVGFAHIPSGDETQADCPYSAQVQVTPPNAFTSVTIAAVLDPCGGRLTASPVVAGTRGPLPGE
ncbi:MAG TPA: DUF4232 domain-containing protein [Chloroflexota bacterium]